MMPDANPSLARDKAHLVGLLCLSGMTPRRLRELLALFGSPSGAWEAVARGAAGSHDPEASTWKRRCAGTDPERLFLEIGAMGIRVIVRGEPDYPSSLAQIHDPPVALFARGRLPAPEHCVALVGSRKATRYGLDVARWLAQGIATAGVCVVSGAAHGIDAAAHDGALCGNGSTIAVLGCGVDVVYPRANARLFDRIEQRGAILSEYPPGTEPRPHRFPARNRIIAGLSQAVVVVEASGRSGALITADCALAEGREVMAVPGQVLSNNSRGTNSLIRGGAALVSSPGDVLAELGLAPVSCESHRVELETADLSPEESSLMRALEGGPTDVDTLLLEVAMPAGRVISTLGSLEIKGLVSCAAGGVYQRRCARRSPGRDTGGRPDVTT